MRDMRDSGVEWIGEIPADWKLIQIKATASCKSEKSAYIGGAYVGLEHIESGSGKLLTDGSQTGIEVDSTVSSFDNTDILFGKLRPYLAKVAKPNFNGQCSTEILVLNPSPQINKDFLFWYLLNPAFIDAVNASTYGAKMPRANWGFIGSSYLSLPPMNVQAAISRILNQKCTQVSTLIANVQAQIEKLKAYKQSVITEVVTKGLDCSVTLKDSGVEWLGMVPEKWAVHRIANLYSERSENGHEDLPILTVSINTGVSDYEVADADKDRVFIRMEDRSKYKRVCPGDLTYNMMRAWQGAFGAVRVDGMVSPAYVVAKPKNPAQIDSRYIEALLRTPSAIEEMHRYSRGIVDFRLRLYWPEFRSIHICLPPIEEQTQIADYIDEKSKQIDKLIAIKQKKIDKLNEYKKSLIYEYVTGKQAVV